ncbi:MAG TPA: PEP-CTERM sorting domain-containing protein [Rhodocyclaceae bacterium]|nr:PEP-CTERM sorting domain-containing protein [Rhodocyclaceae bacterium]
MFKHAVVAATFALALIAGEAQAVNVVDTGTPNGSQSYAFNEFQYFAGKFSLSNDTVINTIESYFSTDVGSIAFSVYSDGGAAPGSLLDSASLITTRDDHATWNGVTNLNWSLVAGSYWVVFQPDFQSAAAEMGGVAPSPLLAYSINHSSGWEVPVSDLRIGVRIDTENLPAPVPEPSSLAMYALGLAGLATMVRRKKTA